MRKYKMTIFNSITLHKTTYIYRFIFDAINHRWDLVDENNHAHPYYKDPLDVMKYFASNVFLRDGEYISIKTMS